MIYGIRKIIEPFENQDYKTWIKKDKNGITLNENINNEIDTLIISKLRGTKQTERLNNEIIEFKKFIIQMILLSERFSNLLHNVEDDFTEKKCSELTSLKKNIDSYIKYNINKTLSIYSSMDSVKNKIYSIYYLEPLFSNLRKDLNNFSILGDSTKNYLMLKQHCGIKLDRNLQQQKQERQTKDIIQDTDKFPNTNIKQENDNIEIFLDLQFRPNILF